MPQFVLIAALGAGLYAGYRLLSRLGGAEPSSDPAENGEPQMAKARVEKDMGRLEYDPETGVYRPSRSEPPRR